jgi:hypothetical protein
MACPRISTADTRPGFAGYQQTQERALACSLRKSAREVICLRRLDISEVSQMRTSASQGLMRFRNRSIRPTNGDSRELGRAVNAQG